MRWAGAGVLQGIPEVTQRPAAEIGRQGGEDLHLLQRAVQPCVALYPQGAQRDHDGLLEGRQDGVL